MDLIEWCKDELSYLLGYPFPDDDIKYFLSFDNKKEVEENFLEFLDKNNEEHLKFVSELLNRWSPIGENSSSKLSKGKTRNLNKESVTNNKKTTSSKKKNKNHKEKQNKPTVEEKNISEEPAQKSKSKQKFVPLFSKEGQAKTIIQIPGRHPCQCLASRHGLVNNCLHCGRIVCLQEGSGPCLTCGNLVCSKAEQLIISQGGFKGEELFRKLTHGKSAQDNLKGIAADLLHRPLKQQSGLDKAVQHKNRLLEFDKTCEKRTRIIDDDADYFSVDSNQWLSDKERKILEQRLSQLKEKHKSRLSRKVTLDFAGRKVIEETDDQIIYDPNDPVLQEIINLSNERPTIGIDDENFPMPVFCLDDSVANSKTSKIENKFVNSKDKWKVNRLQDKELQEMSDEGSCLSMHQPYASLLISGLKKHEGRSWYTTVRGRLWIASASTQPSSQEIRLAENAIRVLSGEDNIIFPNQYPIGCLLGCVDIIDCLPQEEYRLQYPEGESVSPYVFICENPQELIVKFPVKGKHKIYKLDARIHAAAKKTLKKKH